MCKFKCVILSVFIFLCATSMVSAASCGYEERAKLNNETGNIRANYEIKERVDETASIPDALLGTEEASTYVKMTDYFQINILNLTENVYVEVSNNVDKNIKIYNYADTTNGNISFERSDTNTLITYTIKVYASSNTGCRGTMLKTIKVALPRYNEYSEYDVCGSLPDYYLCQRYVTFKEVEFNEFYKNTTAKIEELKNGKKDNEENDKWYQKAGEFLEKHQVAFIIGGITLVVVAGGVTIIIIKRRKRSIIWKRKLK